MFLLTYSVCFPVKIKSARESHFWRFLDFFHGWKSLFHVHFCPPFHGQSKVFTDTCLDFFHGWIFFSREGNSECLLIFTEEIFFSGVQIFSKGVLELFRTVSGTICKKQSIFGS